MSTEPARKSRTLQVDYLARVEGEGAFTVRLKGNKVQEAQFRIFEPPRFFEAFLRGRKFLEAPDITARICGICPIAYQMSSVHAMENAMGIRITGQLRELRRLIYCGEWIESHALHVYMLHAPDFLGYPDAIRMAKDHPETVARGLKIKKTGNEIVELLGGRSIHPINVRVGGFYRVPRRAEFEKLTESLKWARDAAIETVRWVAKLPFPDFEFDYEYVSLRNEGEYPFNEGRMVSSKGLDIEIAEYERNFSEYHVAHSNALQSRMKKKGGYFLGPLARFNLNEDKLSSLAREAAREVGFKPGTRNPFKSIIARSVELVYACDEALRVIAQYERPEKPFADIQPVAGTGQACTEAPRGSLYHRYSVDSDGLITHAQIVPPTSQNQIMMESDLIGYVERQLELDPGVSEDRLTYGCEQLLRNYDPCISCATHFLKLRLEREA